MRDVRRVGLAILEPVLQQLLIPGRGCGIVFPEASLAVCDAEDNVGTDNQTSHNREEQLSCQTQTRLKSKSPAI